VGTISVHSAKREAFDERDERFLTALAAQGATAIANAELYDIRTWRRQQISDILEASLSFGLNQPLDTLLETIATAVCHCSGYRMAVVNLLDETGSGIVVRAMAGVPPAGRHKLESMRTSLDTVMPLLQDEFRISQSYFISHDRCPEIPDLNRYAFTPDLGEREPGEWHQEDILIVPIQTQEKKLLGYISVDDPSDRQLPSLDTVQALEILARLAATAIQNAHLHEERQRRSAEKAREDAIRAERARLETNLHEAMNVLATGVRWEAEILSDQLSRDDPEARRTTLERLQAALARAYADLRYLLEDLRDPTLEQEGLLVALRKRAEIIGGGCILVHGKLDKRLPPDIEGVLYRAGQETMSNAVKHSGIDYNPDVKIEWVCSK
jgi:signal transduction histidine kinase